MTIQQFAFLKEVLKNWILYSFLKSVWSYPYLYLKKNNLEDCNPCHFHDIAEGMDLRIFFPHSSIPEMIPLKQQQQQQKWDYLVMLSFQPVINIKFLRYFIFFVSLSKMCFLHLQHVAILMLNFYQKYLIHI